MNYFSYRYNQFFSLGNICNSHTGYTLYSIVLQSTTMLTKCWGDTQFYTGSGSSFTYFGTVRSSTYTSKGVLIDLQNHLIATDLGYIFLYYWNKTVFWRKKNFYFILRGYIETLFINIICIKIIFNEFIVRAYYQTFQVLHLILFIQ